MSVAHIEQDGAKNADNLCRQSPELSSIGSSVHGRWKHEPVPAVSLVSRMAGR